MDNTLDNISIIKEDNNFNFVENSQKLNKKENNNPNSSKNINQNVFDFEKSLDLSNISPNKDEIKQIPENDNENEKENNNTDINITLDYSFINQNINILDKKDNKEINTNIKNIKTMPLKKIKKEDLDKIPLPIFSCIYCSNEYISFNHLSNEIISKKYLLQTSILDIKQLDYLISFQTKIDKDNINNKLINLVLNNTEYIKAFYETNKIKKYLNSNIFISKCNNNRLNIKKAFKQRLEDIIIRKKKDFYFKEIKGINKIPKTSINNKCLFNSTNSLINNYCGLNSFIGNGLIIPHLQVEKNNNTNQSNSSLYYNSISMNNNNNKNEIGLIGKGNNMHYMENIMEKTNKNIESENTIEEEEKDEILDFLGENDLKRKITKNDIEWEKKYYDIYNPEIDDSIFESNFKKDEYDLITNKKNWKKNKNDFKNIENIKSYNNTLNNNMIHNTKLPLFNNSKSLGSTNTSSNIILKNSVRDKENKSYLSFILNGNKIVNLQNNNSTINTSNINIKNKLANLTLNNNKKEQKINVCNRTPSFTKTRIVDLYSNSEKKLNNHGKSSIDLKNIHKKILFNYTTNIKKELIDNNLTLKIKSAFHNNKRNNIINNKNLIPIKNNCINHDNIENETINNYNKYNILLTKPNINTENLYNKTFFNKTAKGFRQDKDNKKNTRNLNIFFNIKNNIENNILKKQIYKKKQASILNKNKLININHFENMNYFNTIKTKDINFNIRSIEKESQRKKSYNVRKNPKSAKKVNISLPQKLLNANNGVQDMKIKSKSSFKRECIFSEKK